MAYIWNFTNTNCKSVSLFYFLFNELNIILIQIHSIVEHEKYYVDILYLVAINTVLIMSLLVDKHAILNQ